MDCPPGYMWEPKVVHFQLSVIINSFLPHVKVKSSNHSATGNTSMDDSLMMDADSDDEQLIVGKKKSRNKSNAWIDEEAEDDEDDEFKGEESLRGGNFR